MRANSWRRSRGRHGGEFSLNRVARLDAAAALGGRSGYLCLPRLRRLVPRQAAALVRHPLLALDGVTGVTDRVAAILATHSGASLALRGLEHASAPALARLRDNPAIDLPRTLLESNATH